MELSELIEGCDTVRFIKTQWNVGGTKAQRNADQEVEMTIYMMAA
jgi:hypothetical protein